MPRFKIYGKYISKKGIYEFMAKIEIHFLVELQNIFPG